MHNYNAKALALHKKFHGKLSIESKVDLDSKEALSIAYTPGVAQVCKAISKDKKLAREYTIKRNTIAIVSDGSAILGLGNLGPLAAIPVMEGKAALFKKFANVDAFPICLDTQDAEEIIKTVKYIAPIFGGINLEDISAPRCFEIEKRLRKELDIPVFHDDQHGTAIVVLAGLINALNVRGTKNEPRIVVNGAGAAGISITDLLLKNGFKDITVCDSKGVIHESRIGLNSQKRLIAKKTNSHSLRGLLKDAIAEADIFIGVSAKNVLTESMVRSMNQNPIIFAMANPDPEILPDNALRAGALIAATGRSDYPNQINNVIAFPGVFRGALDNQIRDITDSMLIKAAKNLAHCVTKPSKNNILPKPFDSQSVRAVARAMR
ncbi:MAG: NAD-dependent malic enzyme [Parcubacteria group bacterium CG_4_9_14_0_2_um_filter_41_8]|nr:MAG: NAD-dependent malic enzyme [Parcubacteria group bacterium CG1_02_41_12]PIP66803.1 MAG: NAD-dependent malic enzyme [Parcubacteria group bacterium CG22_combo_CG10-13_8_21_14_all_41_9]PIQ79977.1 MAG: NAD-dependent malic enzyme [Parcubacteria group bacterium CG11_big_fil_rev_8_21_14_0_20_41_14]PIR57171.1 MAG: NAD-dependent malic enzyme [Parcubacteria group bacterium CG10_big_fil_rev_8_21_14_0_10_41_35]PIZ81567.1 MAG: NAD-dependent malic enzyme [Parcubacteria group bacterium CG_4_10_14_0_2_u